MTKMKKPRNKMPLRFHNIDHMPSNITGVYAFWCRVTGKCIYVGKAKERPIQKRLKEHWRGSDIRNLQLWIQAFGQFLDICYLPVKYEKINQVEVRLIKMWHPEINVIHNQ